MSAKVMDLKGDSVLRARIMRRIVTRWQGLGISFSILGKHNLSHCG